MSEGGWVGLPVLTRFTPQFTYFTQRILPMMTSYLCPHCHYPALDSEYTDDGINDWMEEVIVCFDNGDRISGPYDHHGTVRGIDLENYLDGYYKVDSEYCKFTLYHRSCCVARKETPKFTEQSPEASPEALWLYPGQYDYMDPAKGFTYGLAQEFRYAVEMRNKDLDSLRVVKINKLIKAFDQYDVSNGEGAWRVFDLHNVYPTPDSIILRNARECIPQHYTKAELFNVCWGLVCQFREHRHLWEEQLKDAFFHIWNRSSESAIHNEERYLSRIDCLKDIVDDPEWHSLTKQAEYFTEWKREHQNANNSG